MKSWLAVTVAPVHSWTSMNFPSGNQFKANPNSQSIKMANHG